MQVAGLGQTKHVAAVHAPEHTRRGHFTGDIVTDVLILQLLLQFQSINQGLVGYRKKPVCQGVSQ